MTTDSASSTATCRVSTESWLAARSQGPCPRWAALAARAVVRLPGTGRGRKPVGPDGHAPGSDRRAGPAFFAVDRSPRNGPAASSLRDVARGARAGAAGAAHATFPSCCRRSAGTNRAPWPLSKHGPVRKLASLAAWGLRSIAPGGARAGGASCLRWPISSCPIRAPRRISSFVSSVFRASESASFPTASFRRSRSASPELFQARWGTEPFVLSVGRIEPRKNTLGLIRALRGLGLPLVVIGEAPPGCERL